jgi:hypothetical protein
MKAPSPKGAPRHKEHNAPGGPKNPFGQKADKAAILAKLAANAKKPAKS